jgi:hypothetical protein
MEKVAASFRDPSGFVFTENGQFFRAIHENYRENYDLLKSSGLYQELVDRRWLLPHEEETPRPEIKDGIFKVIKPHQLATIFYAHEWSFSQLKDVALTVLQIQQRAIARGMSLKDASTTNFQFVDGKPILIDTLSFEQLPVGQPWIAYHQFCRQFLAPLALMNYRDIRLQQLMRIYLDGIPLDLACSLLPRRSWFNMGIFLHLVLHNASQRRSEKAKSRRPKRPFGVESLIGLVRSLEFGVQRLQWRPPASIWSRYYDELLLSDQYRDGKKALVLDFLKIAQPSSVWDLGANTGFFSRLASQQGILTMAFDVDPVCVELNYLEARQKQEKNLLPLVMDVMNPSRAGGWDLAERMSWFERAHPDLVMALALVHHLAIANNVPLDHIARFFHRLGQWILIEFVPKADPNLQKLLENRADIFPHYHQARFEQEFDRFFELVKRAAIPNSGRVLYLWKKREPALKS